MTTVSMLPAHGLGYLDFCLKNVNKSDKPFGGRQAIFVGDFYQVSTPPLAGTSLLPLLIKPE